VKPPPVASPVKSSRPEKVCRGIAAFADNAKALSVTVPVAELLRRVAAVSWVRVTKPEPMRGSPGTGVTAAAAG
jgi:hypothetical protein